MPNGFEFEQAFDRNIGWITEAELQTLRRKRVVAIREPKSHLTPKNVSPQKDGSRHHGARPLRGGCD